MSKNPYLRGPEMPWSYRCRRCNGGYGDHLCQHCFTVLDARSGDATLVSDWLRRKYGRQTKLQAQAVASAVLSHLTQERGQ